MTNTCFNYLLIEIRCDALNAASVEAKCTYNYNWVSCDSPVLPGTNAHLSCRDSYQPTANLRAKENVKCNINGRWEPQPIQCVPGPLTINIYINDTKITLQTPLSRNNATLIEILKDRVVIRTSRKDSNNPDVDVKIPKPNSNSAKKSWIWS